MELVAPRRGLQLGRMTIEQPTRTIEAIQCLRGIAASMVVLHHLQNQTQRLGLPYIPAETLQAGVDIFFVISGFIMWVTTAGRPERTAGAFYRDRVVRIVPLYWMVTGFMVAVMVVAPSVLSTSALDGSHIVRSLLFIPAPHPVTGAYLPTLIPGWTLNMEMFFYLLFGVVLFISGTRTRLRAWLSLSSLALLVAIGAVFRPAGAFGFYTQGMLIEFAAGIGIGLAYMNGRVARSRWWWAATAVGFGALALQLAHPSALDRGLAWGAPAAAIVAGAALGPRVSARALERLGDWSYALYLSHPITLAACHKAWSVLPSAVPVGLFPLFALGCAILCAGAIFRFLEQPATRATRRLLGSGAASRSLWAAMLTIRRRPAPDYRSLR